MTRGVDRISPRCFDRAEASGESIAMRLFTMGLNPATRGPAWNWSRFPDRAAEMGGRGPVPHALSVAATHAQDCYAALLVAGHGGSPGIPG